MNELDAIQASLASFTKRLDEVSNDRFNELRKCSFFDPIPSECLKPISEHAEIRTFPRLSVWHWHRLLQQKSCRHHTQW
jgi:hypothetical protein